MDEKHGISTKKFMTAELKGHFDASPNFVITNYKGLSSQEIENLRRELRRSASKYFVVKNSMLKRILTELKQKDLDSFVKDEVGVGFIGDIIGASKTLASFSKEHAALKLRCAFLEGKIETPERIKHLALLPSREVLLALVVGYIKSPITGFVGTLRSLLRNFVYAINEIKNKKEGGEKNG